MDEVKVVVDFPIMMLIREDFPISFISTVGWMVGVIACLLPASFNHAYGKQRNKRYHDMYQQKIEKKQME